MTAFRQAGLLALAAFLPAIGEAIYLRPQVSWQSAVADGDSATVKQAERWGANTLWVDARPSEDFAHEHVPGALLLNEDHWDDLLPRLLETWAPEKRVVVYCSSQACGASREVARRLRTEAGLKNVFVLTGGWEAWVAARR